MTCTRRLAAILAAVAFASSLRAGEPRLVDGVAAYVNEHVITIGDVQTMMDPVRRQLVARYTGDDLVRRLRAAYDDALQAIVERYLVLDAYEKMDKKLPDWFVDERIRSVIDEQFGGDRSKLMDQLAKESMSFEDWRKEVGNHVAITYMRQMNVDEKISISPMAVRDEYEKRKDEFTEPAKIKLSLIAMDRAKGGDVSAARAMADDVRRRAAGGEDFAALAKKHSSDTSAESGGDWGWVEPRVLRADLAKVAGALGPGETSEVIDTGDQYYILRVDGRREASARPFADVQPEIERSLRAQEGRRLMEAWIARLRARSYVRILNVTSDEPAPAAESEP